MVSLAGHCTVFASYISWLHLKTIQLNKLQHKGGLSIQVVTNTGCTVLEFNFINMTTYGTKIVGFNNEAVLQVFAIEFVTLAIKFILLAIEFITLALEFIRNKGTLETVEIEN